MPSQFAESQIELTLNLVQYVAGNANATAIRDAFLAGTVRTGERVIVLAGHPIEGGPRFPTVRVVRVGAGGTSTEP